MSNFRANKRPIYKEIIKSHKTKKPTKIGKLLIKQWRKKRDYE